MQRLLLIISIIIIALIAGFFALNTYIYKEKQTTPSEEIKPYRGTLSGEYVCLPHTNQNGPQTLECAFGIKTTTGEYYAVDFTLMSQTTPVLKAGDKFTASGTITPIEMLSTDHWQKYPIKGIFSITDSVEKQN
jgi:hypothetical protein